MQTKVLIIGAGLAGLTTAYRLAQKGVECVVVTKDEEIVEGANSVLAQGGIIYRSAEDKAEDLEEDIIVAGAKINSEAAVEQLATEGVDLVKEVLIDGVKAPFDMLGDELMFSMEAAHSRKRIIHVKDHTGRSIMESMKAALENHPKVTWLRGHVLVDLLTSGHNCRGYEYKYKRNRCLGAFLFDKSKGTVKRVMSNLTVLCTGGIGQVYEYHTNAEHAFGSGLAAANRARVRIINSRFVQFHPTALWTEDKGRRFLISESLRGAGARLQNMKGEYFMEKYPQKDLESRAVISRVIMEELEASGEKHVYLNLAEHYQGDSPIAERFPSIYERCMQEGIDISKDPIPVIPAEHFFCGGIYVDLNGQTEMPGLYAAGEVACSGLHGANRLASTSLLECLTWGVKAADDIVEKGTEISTELEKAFSLVDEWESFGELEANPEEIAQEKDQIRQLMWKNVGILRSEERLFKAKDELFRIWKSIEKKYSENALSEDLIELRHMAETAYIITTSASSHTSLREDSIGGHVLKG